VQDEQHGHDAERGHGVDFNARVHGAMREHVEIKADLGEKMQQQILRGRRNADRSAKDAKDNCLKFVAAPRRPGGLGNSFHGSTYFAILVVFSHPYPPSSARQLGDPQQEAHVRL
jgi:hypothetical protein